MYDSIYLLQTRESIFKNDDVFKIGRTSQDELKRFNCYPKGSKLHLHISCFNGIHVEKLIIDLFNNKYTNVPVYGAEYFKGDLCTMIKDILHTIGHNFDSIHSHSTLSTVFREKDSAITQLKQQNHALQLQNDALKLQVNDLQLQIVDLTHRIRNFNIYDTDMNGYKNNYDAEEDRSYLPVDTQLTDGIRCSKCNKKFTRKDHMRVHEKKCKGLIDPRQCQTCLKVFTSAWGRLKHNKNVKCSPPTSGPSTASHSQGFQGDAIEGIGVDLNYPDEDDDMEKERERRNKEMEQLVGETLYNETLEAIRRAELSATKSNGLQTTIVSS